MNLQQTNRSTLENSNLPTYIKESLHQAGMAHIPQGQAQAIAQHLENTKQEGGPQ